MIEIKVKYSNGFMYLTSDLVCFTMCCVEICGGSYYMVAIL